MGIDTAQPGARRASRTTRFFAPDSKAGATFTSSLSGALAQLSEELSTTALRSATHAGAKVLYDELHQRVSAMSDSGQLLGSVYRWHDDDKSVGGKQTYAIGVNKRKAPHWYNVEYGHWRINVLVKVAGGKFVATKERLKTPVWVEAHPYLRPTWDAASAAAMSAMKGRLAEKVRELTTGAGA